VAEQQPARPSTVPRHAVCPPHELDLLDEPDEEGRSNGTLVPAARQAYMKGRYHWRRSGPAGVLEALEFFEQAVAIDPRFASAHAALGRVQVAAAEYYIRAPGRALEAARASASRALSLDPANSMARLVLAEVWRSI